MIPLERITGSAFSEARAAPSFRRWPRWTLWKAAPPGRHAPGLFVGGVLLLAGLRPDHATRRCAPASWGVAGSELSWPPRPYGSSALWRRRASVGVRPRMRCVNWRYETTTADAGGTLGCFLLTFHDSCWLTNRLAPSLFHDDFSHHLLRRETRWQPIPHAEISFPYGTTL